MANIITGNSRRKEEIDFINAKFNSENIIIGEARGQEAFDIVNAALTTNVTKYDETQFKDIQNDFDSAKNIAERINDKIKAE